MFRSEKHNRTKDGLFARSRRRWAGCTSTQYLQFLSTRPAEVEEDAGAKDGRDRDTKADTDLE